MKKIALGVHFSIPKFSHDNVEKFTETLATGSDNFEPRLLKIAARFI